MKKLSKNSKNKSDNQKAVFIDWNGTLSPTNFWSHLEKSEKLIERNMFKSWADTMFIKHKDRIVPWMKGSYTSEELISLVAQETDTKFEDVFREFVAGCERMEYSSPNIPDLITILRNKSVIVSVATNNMDSFTRWTVPSMKLDTLFDEILNSFYIKAMKHDLDKDGNPLFFDSFFKKYNIDPANCIFIDDGEDKMGVIGSLGMDYRRINTSTNTLESQLQSIIASL